MKKKIVLLMCALLTLNMIGCGQGNAEISSEVSQVITEASEETPGEEVMNPEMENLYQELINVKQDTALVSEDQKVIDYSMNMFNEVIDTENPFMSPLSAYFVLSMAGSGAMGDTRQQIDQALGNNHAIISRILLKELSDKSTELFTLSLANAVWVDDDMLLNSGYEKLLSEGYQTEIHNMNLEGNEAFEQINSWCNEQTRGMIPSILDQPLDDAARMVLLNAIYMDAKWTKKFPREGSVERSFTLENGEEIKVMTMHDSDGIRNYLSTEYGTGVILPYKDSDLSFVAILPTEGTGVRECYARMMQDDMKVLMESGTRIGLDLYLPKFEVNTKMNLIPVAQNMGIQNIFNDKLSDLSAMGQDVSGEPLYASKFIQKAAIKVDEEGTQASAVTAMVVDKATAMYQEEEIITLRFDRPFVYMIVHEPTGTPVFMGIMDNPAAE